MTKVQFQQFDVSELFQGVWETLKLPQSTPVFWLPHSLQEQVLDFTKDII